LSDRAVRRDLILVQVLFLLAGIAAEVIDWVLSSRLSDNTSRFRLRRNHLHRADSRRRGLVSKDCHGLTEPKAVDLAAKSSSSQLGHRGNLCRLWLRVRRLDYLGHKDSQTSLQECELPFGRKAASLATLLLWAGMSHSGNPTFAAFGGNGTNGQPPVGPVCAHPLKVLNVSFERNGGPAIG
jgi:hypothetical protein